MAAITAATGAVDALSKRGDALTGVAGATIKQGWWVAVNTATGKIIPAGGATAQVVLGVAVHDADTDEELKISTEVYAVMVDSAITPSLKDYGKPVYLQNQNSASLTAGSGLQYAGICLGEAPSAYDGTPRIWVDPRQRMTPAMS